MSGDKPSEERLGMKDLATQLALKMPVKLVQNTDRTELRVWIEQRIEELRRGGR